MRGEEHGSITTAPEERPCLWCGRRVNPMMACGAFCTNWCADQEAAHGDARERARQAAEFRRANAAAAMQQHARAVAQYEDDLRWARAAIEGQRFANSDDLIVFLNTAWKAMQGRDVLGMTERLRVRRCVEALLADSITPIQRVS